MWVEKELSGGRTAFWSDGTVVIRHSDAPDGGTAFRPRDGHDYFLGLKIVLHLTRAELLLLAGSVNEALEAVDDWEFSTRLGADKVNARALRTELADLIATLPPE